MTKPGCWLDLTRLPRGPGHSAAQGGQPPPIAIGQHGLQLRCVMWLVGVCFFDLSAPPMMVLLFTACVVDVWLVSRSAASGLGAQAAVTHLQRRLSAAPAQVWWFIAIMALNVALEQVLLEPVSRPYFFNIMVLHAMILGWACVTTPNTRLARVALHRGATWLICILAALLLLQLVLQFGVGYTLDLRELLTGEPSRSGVDESTPGERPTTVFTEPSNLAIVVFMLTLVTRLTGPQHSWLTAVAGMTCLLNGSGIGLFLAAYLLVEEALLKLKQHLVLVPLIVTVVLALAWLGVILNLDELKIGAIERIVHPQTNYDPVGVRLYVPLRIANFDSWQHLIGTGMANYAAFKDGFTQYDSSFVLGVYFQTGMLGIPIMLLTLVGAWRVHSWRAAAMLLVLYSTKMGLMSPGFWALVVLLNRRGAVCPPAHAQHRRRSPPSPWLRWWPTLTPARLLMALLPQRAMSSSAPDLAAPTHTVRSPHLRQLSFPHPWHARRTHHSHTERRRR
jgi:hypothetical protein